MLELPTKDLMKEPASLCVRPKLSQRAATSLYAKIILSGGGDLQDFVKSKLITFSHRILIEKETATKIKIQFKDLPILMQFFTEVVSKSNSNQEQWEHLIICLQEVASDKQTQFISAPQTPDGTGATECEALVWYINKCRIEDQVIGHVRATNTGRHNDAAVLLDKAMKRANLWLAC